MKPRGTRLTLFVSLDKVVVSSLLIDVSSQA